MKVKSLVRGGVCALAALAVAVGSVAPAWADGVPGGVRVVVYRGYVFDVPRAWPVVDLAADPGACVLMTRHVLYLGTPGSNEDCPGGGAGRVTEAMVVQPAGGRGVARSVLDAAARQITVSAPGIRVTASYGGDEALVLRILAGASLPAPVTQAARPLLRAGAASVPGPGSTSFQGKGFDTCAAPGSSVMSAWLSSPYRAVGIYIGGSQRACGQSNLSAAWVSQQYSAGWRFIPLYVGVQGAYGQITSPASQASASADDAVAQAQSLGFGPGAVIYYDMEGGSGGNPMTTVLSFLSDWTADLHAHGYKSGVYSSSSYAVQALAANYTSYTMPDVIYDALWNGQANTADPVIGASEWASHQRVHQYEGGVDQTYGGITQNIDLDYLDVIIPGTPGSAPSPLSEDSAGEMVAFVNSSGRLVNDYYLSSWQGPGVLPGTPRPDSPIVVSPDGKSVYFIESNGDVANDYYTASGWAGPGLTGGAAAAGSGLAFTPGSSSAGTGPAVAFVDSSGTLVNDYRTASGWGGPGPLPGSPRKGTPLLWNATGNGVFFIESNGDVVNDYHTSSGWGGPGLTGGAAAAGSGLAFTPGSSSAGTNLAVAFVDTSGALVNDYHTASGWGGPGPLPGSPRAGTPLWWNASGNGVFFIESNGDVVNDYHTSSGWGGPGLTGGTAAVGSALTYAPGNGTTSGPNVMFIDSSGALVNDYYTSAWHGPGPLPGTPR